MRYYLKKEKLQDKDIDYIKGLFIDDLYQWNKTKKIITNKKEMLRGIRERYILTHKQIDDFKAYINGMEETFQEWK